MQTQITARHFTAGPELRTYASESLTKLERFYDGITDAHVILTYNHNAVLDKHAEVTVNVYRQKLAARDEGTTHEAAIDGCVKSLQRQIKKYKSKLRRVDQNAHR